MLGNRLNKINPSGARFGYFAALTIFSFQLVNAQAPIIAEIKGASLDEVSVVGFVLTEKQSVSIEGLGYKGKGKWWGTRAWILNSDTREVVWQSTKAGTKDRRAGMQEFSDAVDLFAGKYELYFSAYPHLAFNVRGIADLLEELSVWIFDWSPVTDDLKKLYIVVRGKGQRVESEKVAGLRTGFLQNAIVSITDLGSHENRREGFTLEKPTEVDIYALGELRDDGSFDYGWIINARTGERVWKMTMENTNDAGGAEKNRIARTSLSLSPGSYVAFYVTDDSHGPGEWNAAPPFDPALWGITIRLKDQSARRYVKPYTYTATEKKNVIIELIRVRDNEIRSKGFSLNRPMKLRIYSLGEGRNGRMYDYGWIIDPKTHKRFWSMDYKRTEHAGGGDKNRLIDETVSFEKGKYLVYYSTDDSHSYRSWNTSSPSDPEHWGITISTVEENVKSGDVSSFDPEDQQEAIARLAPMGDWERAKSRFRLEADTRVRIYALGEGDRRDMYDHGFIEDAPTGRVVWEMKYDRTAHAGGARKNRLADETILLAAGEYILRYVSDGSHSSDGWNDTPPYDIGNWGITVFPAAEK